ncbi:YciI family protein [Kribbella sp. CWNU-51]
MAEYLIAFNEEWLPDLTDEDLRNASKAVRALRAEMTAAGVLIFTGGLDDAAPVFSVDASSGPPVFTDGPYVESKEHLGGFAVVDVADEEAARLWAGKIAVACGWPQEVRRFQYATTDVQTPETA